MKKLVSILLTVVMLITMSTAFAADAYQQDYPQSFWDVPKDHWAFNYVAELVNKGVLAGYEDGSFRPDDTVTRAEWAKIMVLAAGLPVNDYNVYFTDMYDHWANIYVNTAKDYLAAYTDGTYKPDQAAVREDVTVSMVKLKGYDVNNADYSYLNQFTDISSISNSLKAYVAVAVQKDLINGFEDGTFRGQNTLTRAEAATLLWRAFQYGNDNKVVDVPVTPIATPAKSTTAVQTPKPTNKPQQTSNTTPTKEPEQTISQEKEKPYVIDTLKQVSIEYNYTYDGDKIYYIDGTKIYSLDPYTGSTSVIYNTDDLVLQKTETQESEVTKTATVSPEDDDEALEDEEEMTEIVTEEAVVAEYSNYIPTQVMYDQYNDRLIMTGYYKKAEEAFKSPDNNASYYVSYDITNDELFWDSGKNYYDRILEFRGFLSKDKAVILDGGSEDIVNTDTKSKINDLDYSKGFTFWSIGNEMYSCDYSFIYIYDFSSNKFDEIFSSSLNCIGINGNDVYYFKNNVIYKLNLTSGKAVELEINTKSDYCDVLDMMIVSDSNMSRDFIPVSDEFFVFYDKEAEAFRTLSKR